MRLAVAPISDMLVTVKSREIQRAMTAEGSGNRNAAARHFRAAAHLELVLADDYEQAGDLDLAVRSRLSAASCLWRGGMSREGRKVLNQIAEADPARASEVREIIADLKTLK